MIKLDKIGEEAIERALIEVKRNRDDPSLRKKNNAPEEMIQYKRGGKENADKS